MASSRRVLLRLQGDSGDARRAVNEVRADLRRMSREEATVRVDIQTQRVERQIELVKRRLADLAKQSPSPQVDANTTRAQERLTLLEFRLDRLRLRKVQIDVDVRRGGIERTAAALTSVERGLGGIVTGTGNALRAIPIFGQIFATVLDGAISLATKLGSALGGLVTTGIETLANSFRTLSGLGSLAGPIGSVVAGLAGIAAQGALVAGILGGLIIALNAVLGAVVALAGALTALVASLTAAVLGLGALGIAFGGVLIPVIAVAIGLFTRFAAIIKARQTREQALTQSIQAQRTAERQRKDALDATRQAHEQLAQATIDGNRAMAQSVVDLRDAQLGLESSQLGVKEARLSLKEAQQSLKEFVNQAGVSGPKLGELTKQFSNVEFNPAAARGALTAAGGKTDDPLELQRRILAVQRSQLGVKEAINQTAHAEDTLAQATKKRADFVKRGIEAYKPYRTALLQVQKAETRLARAQTATTAAQRKYEKALKDLSPVEKTSLSNLDKFIKGFKELAKAFTDPIFRAANDVFDSLSGKAGFLKSSLTLVGEAMGDALRQFGLFLGQPATIAAFQTMARGAADLVRTLGGRAMVSGLTILREIAITALPTMRRMANDVADALGRIAGQPGRIHRATETVLGQFRSWLRLAGSVLGLIRDIFIPASREGKNLADSMRHVVDRWREWIRANPEKIREFFRTSVRRARDIVHWIKQAASWLKNDLPRAAAAARNAFKNMYTWVKKVYDLVKKIIDLGHGKFKLFGKEINLPGPLDVAQGPNVIPRALGGQFGGQNKLEKAIAEALKPRVRPRRPQTQDLRSPDARTATAAVSRGDFHAHITVPGGKAPDERVLLAKMAREAEKLGLVG